MSTSNMPIQGDANWLKSLTPGTPMYFSEYVAIQNEVVLHKLIFVKYDTKAVKAEGSDAIYAVLKPENSDKIDIPSMDISCGFFATPLEALEKFENTISTIHKAAEKAIRDENKRLEKMVKAKIKQAKKENK